MFIGNFIGPFDRNYFYAKLGGFVFFGHVYLTCWKMVKDSMNENICIFPNSLNGLKGSNTFILLKIYLAKYYFPLAIFKRDKMGAFG